MTYMPDRDVIFNVAFPTLADVRAEILQHERDAYDRMTTPYIEIPADHVFDDDLYVYVNDVDETDYSVVREIITYDEKPTVVLVDDHHTRREYRATSSYTLVADFSTAAHHDVSDVLTFIAQYRRDNRTDKS